MVRVIYDISDKSIVTVIDAADGSTAYASDKSAVEDTEENIIAAAQALGITDIQPIQDYLDQQA